MNDYQPVKISLHCRLENNKFQSGKQVWGITRLIERAKGLESFDLPLQAINIGTEIWNPIQTPKKLAEHMKQVMAADLDYPVILDDEGFIMDGWHRVARALFEGRATIKAVRFEVTPSCDFIED